MAILQKFNIKEKMILGYIPIFLVTIAIAVFSLQSLREYERINREIVETDTAVLLVTDKIVDNLLAQEAHGSRYLILGSPQMLEIFRQRDRDFIAQLDEIRVLSHGGNIHLEKLAALHQEFNGLYEERFKLYGTGDIPLSLQHGEQIQISLDKMIAVIQKMAELVRESRQDKIIHAGELGVRTFRITAILSLVGLLLGCAAASLITRSLARSISELKKSAEMVSEGKFDHLPDINTRDELGELGRFFGEMTQRLARLEEMQLDSNPLTRLPGGTAIENVLKNRLESGNDVAFCLIDLDNFKSFNDRYGYALGNEVIKTTGNIIQAAVAGHGTVDSFVGHIGGDDFAAIVVPRIHEKICQTIIKEFDRKIIDYYNSEDRNQGYITGKTRQGLAVRFPIMTISMAVVSTEEHKNMNYIEIGEIAAELKEHAKSLPGSVYVVNRRDRQQKRSVFLPKLVGNGAK